MWQERMTIRVLLCGHEASMPYVDKQKKIKNWFDIAATRFLLIRPSQFIDAQKTEWHSVVVHFVEWIRSATNSLVKNIIFSIKNYYLINKIR
jgi:hypothetical protein